MCSCEERTSKAPVVKMWKVLCNFDGRTRSVMFATSDDFKGLFLPSANTLPNLKLTKLCVLREPLFERTSLIVQPYIFKRSDVLYILRLTSLTKTVCLI